MTTNVEPTTPFDEHVPSTAEQGATAAPEKKTSKKGASPKKDAPKAKKEAKAGKAKPATAKKTKAEPKAKPAKSPAKKAIKSEAKAPRAETKGAKLLAMIARPKGASLEELMKELAWQAHSIRGFISIAGKKGAKIESSRNEAGERIYKSGK